MGTRTTPENTGRQQTKHERDPTGGCIARSSSRFPRSSSEAGAAGCWPRDFAAQLTGSREKLPYTMAIHRGGAEGENPHAHLMYLGAGTGRDRAERRAVVPALQREGSGDGRCAEIAGGQGRGLAGEDPRGVGADGEPGAEAGGPCRADRRPQPGRSAGRSAPGRRPEAGGRVEPGAERPSRPGAVQDDPGRGVGDGSTGRARRAEERSGPGRAGRRQQAGGAAGAGDRPDRSAAEGDL